MTGFVHLRLHTEYSLTDGVVRVEPPKRKGGGQGATLTSRAAEMGYPDPIDRDGRLDNAS